jgi:RecB family exonuclease
VRIIPYRKVSDLDPLLRDFLGKETRFIVPSRRDREWWRLRAGLRDFGLEPDSETRLWNWEDLFNDICAFLDSPILRQIDPPDHRLILSYLVAELLKENQKENREGDALPPLLKLWPGLARPGFLDILSDDIRELLNEAVSVEQLSVTVFDDKPTSKVLPWLYGRYLLYLRHNRLLDSAQIPLKALELLENSGEMAEDWGRNKRFVFAGFMSCTHGQFALLQKLEKISHEELVLLKPATELVDFQDATRQFKSQENTWEDDPPIMPGVVVSLSISEHSLEPELVARTLALWQAGTGVLATLTPPEGEEKEGEEKERKEGRTLFPGFGVMGISTPPHRMAALEAALRRYHIPYSLARGRSIAQTFLGTTLTSLWTTWVQGLNSYDTALLLAQPCLGGPGFSIDGAVRAGPRGVKEWAAYLKQAAKNAVHQEETKNAKRALKAFKALTKFCLLVDKGASPSRLLGAFHSFLTMPGLWVDALACLPESNPDLDDSLRELVASVEEVEDKGLALRELQPDLGPAGKVLLQGKEAIDFLQSWCEETLVQPSPPLRGAVVLYDGPPPILASHSVWIITDVTQKNWPGLIRSSPLLDASEREAMVSVSAYLPSIHDKYTQKEALFRRLLQTGDNLTVTSHSTTDEEGRPTNVTSFMDSFFTDMKVWEHPVIPTVGIGGLTPGRSEAYFPAIEVEISEKRERAMPVAQGSRRGAEALRLPVSGLYNLLDCPLRYWLERNARLKERDTKLFSKAMAGQLTHKIWEAIWHTQQKTSETLSFLTAEEWRRALSLEADYSAFEVLLKDRRLERHRKNMEFYLQRLAHTQQAILDRLAACGLRHRLVSAETELPPYQVEGVIFTGRCDRVEVFEDGSVVIVDYKWGRSASYEKGLANLASRRHFAAQGDVLIGDGLKRESFKYGLQLSAYALMYAIEHSEGQVAGVGFLGHGDGTLAGTFAPPVAGCYLPNKKTSVSLQERKEEALAAMKCAAALLKSQRYEPCYVAESCRHCGVKGVCRKGELRGDTLPMAEMDMEDWEEEQQL